MTADAGELIACHECDRVHFIEPIPADARASCRRCGAHLYGHVPDSLTRATALYLSALVLILIANLYPFLSLQVGGRIEETMLLAGAWALAAHGMGAIGFLVFLTSVAFPFLVIVGMLYLLVPVRMGQRPPAAGLVYRAVNGLAPWSLLGVFMLSVLIAIVKLQSMAKVIPGTALLAVAALIVVYSAARSQFDPHAFWAKVPWKGAAADAVAGGEPTLSCRTCHLLVLQRDGHDDCPRCGTPLHERIRDSVERTWALVVTAAILFVPANLLPIMTVSQMGAGEPDTIFSGIVKLMSMEMYGLALIVFFVSLVVPLAKLASLSWLLRSVQTRSSWSPRDRTLLYRVTEVAGSWSMVDVFIVGLLTALVSIGAMAGISPGLGIVFFAMVVVITMFAAASFDPRLIWDNLDEEAAAKA